MTDRAVILTRLARLAAANAGHQQLAARLGEAARLLLGADGTWITVVGHTDSRAPLFASDEIATRLEDVQDLVGQGPCVTALRDGTSATATVSRHGDGRWPEFTRSVLHSMGPLTVHAFPLHPGNETFGVLGTYLADRPGELLEPPDTAQFLADMVGAALLGDPAPSEPGTDDDRLWSARAEIDQATGMVIAQLQVPPADALAILRSHAFANDTSLAETAHEVVARRIDFRADS